MSDYGGAMPARKATARRTSVERLPMGQGEIEKC